jgi:alkylhydroperoxidase/carboxymuconolactone decarboxylase family protein YurZ
MQAMNKKTALDFLKTLDSEVYEGFKENVSPCPDLTNALIEHLYGNLYQRSQISLRERLLVTIAVLMASGNMMGPQLALQLRIALKNGIKREELMEVAFQISVFCGFANAINASNIVESMADLFGDGSTEDSKIETAQ